MEENLCATYELQETGLPFSHWRDSTMSSPQEAGRYCAGAVSEHPAKLKFVSPPVGKGCEFAVGRIKRIVSLSGGRAGLPLWPVPEVSTKFAS